MLPPLPDGRVRPAVLAPAAVLSRAATAVDPRDPDVVALAADLLASQRSEPGCVGLAAPQLGVPWRVFSLDVTGHPKARTWHGPMVLVNPVVLAATRWERGREGCLSVPDLTGDVTRATSVVVVGLAPGTGEERRIEANAFEARAFQHELDHLNGLLFLDRIAGPHALFPRKRYL